MSERGYGSYPGTLHGIPQASENIALDTFNVKYEKFLIPEKTLICSMNIEIGKLDKQSDFFSVSDLPLTRSQNIFFTCGYHTQKSIHMALIFTNCNKQSYCICKRTRSRVNFNYLSRVILLVLGRRGGRGHVGLADPRPQLLELEPPEVADDRQADHGPGRLQDLHGLLVGEPAQRHTVHLEIREERYFGIVGRVLFPCFPEIWYFFFSGKFTRRLFLYLIDNCCKSGFKSISVFGKSFDHFDTEDCCK